MTSPPRITTTPRAQQCATNTVWDAESAILQTTFEYEPATNATAVGTLRDRLDEGFRMRVHTPRLVLGEVDIVYNDEQRIGSIELRTGLDSWQRGSIDDVPADAPPEWITFDVPFDENCIFSIDLPVSITWDAVAGRLAFLFSTAEVAHWSWIADGAAVGISAEGTLVEMRFSDIAIRAAG